MRVAIVSDIHGNRHAFEAVLDAIEASECQEMWCLGDLVGYGAEPDACVELARRYAAICLAGNHDLGVRGALPLEEFSRGAALAARWTQGVITPETREYLDKLEPAHLDEHVGLFHASPRDPIWEYVLSPLQAELCLDAQIAPGLPDRPLARRAVVLARRRASRPAARRRAADEQLDLDGGRVADQPGQRGPAARRRPSRRLARAGPRRLGGRLPPHGIRHRRGRRGDPCRPASRLAGRTPRVRPVRGLSTRPLTQSQRADPLKSGRGCASRLAPSSPAGSASPSRASPPAAAAPACSQATSRSR